MACHPSLVACCQASSPNLVGRACQDAIQGGGGGLGLRDRDPRGVGASHCSTKAAKRGGGAATRWAWTQGTRWGRGKTGLCCQAMQLHLSMRCTMAADRRDSNTADHWHQVPAAKLLVQTAA